MVVALLGVLKAGGAYVPLDPALSAGAAGLHVRRMPAPLVVLDQERLARRREPRSSSRSFWPPSSAAYVIYTSGSTGRPKGVGCPTAALVNPGL